MHNPTNYYSEPRDPYEEKYSDYLRTFKKMRKLIDQEAGMDFDVDLLKPITFRNRWNNGNEFLVKYEHPAGCGEETGHNYIHAMVYRPDPSTGIAPSVPEMYTGKTKDEPFDDFM